MKTFEKRSYQLTATILLAAMLFAMVCEFIPPVTAADYELLNPITGTVQGAGYDETAGHYGIDLYPYNYGDPVYAVASGTIMYSCERNHTKAIQSGDDCCTVKIILDEPITYNGTKYVCAFYTHMSALVYDVYCGYKSACVEEYNAGLRTNALPTESVHVEAGDLIGYVGKGNGATHLHFSFEAAESDGYAMMPNSGYYDVFGWCYNERITASACDPAICALAATTGVKAKLDAFMANYPSGNTWTSSFDGGIECYGFAKLAVYNVFGSYSSSRYRSWNYNGVSTSGMSVVGSITSYSAANVKQLLSQAKCGDVLQFNTPKQHSMIVYSVESDGVKIYDCNWVGYCKISLRKVEFGAWSGRNSTKLTLLRSDNYSAIGDDSPSVVPDTCTCSTSYAGTYTCATSSYPLTIRSGHGASYSAIGSIPSGATVTVTKANGSWAHVTYNGISGYASMEYLTQPLQSDSAYPVPFKCYPLADATHAADAYDAVNGNHIGYIYGTDYCTVKAVYDNGWCLVNCPWNGGTKDVYAWTGAFLNITCSPFTEVVQAYATSYIRLGSSTELGWVDVGDRVTIVDNTSSRAQIIYPHTDGSYRCAWVDFSAFTHNHTPGVAATCTTPQVCTTCDVTLVNAYGHSAGVAATCTNPQTCTRCGIVINDATGHTPGMAATCTTAQTCTVCGAIVSPAKGHSYTAGTYTDPVHPHNIYNTCACGAMQDTGTTGKVTGCTECYPSPTVSGITYSPATVKVGDTVTFTLSATNATQYSFAVGNGSVTLTESGKIASNQYTYSFSSIGTYYVWGSAFNDYGETACPGVTVNVVSANVSVSGVSLNKSSASINTGDTLNLTATVSPANATNQTVTWTSSNTSVATVVNGTVTALKSGTTTITVTTADGSKTATCVVTVEDAVTSYEASVYTESKKTAVQGSQFTYTVSLAGSYDGFSFEIASGDGLTVTNITTTNSNINIDEISDKWMISVLGGLAKHDSEKDELVTVTVQVASDARLGSRTLTLSNLMVSNESGDKVSAIQYEYATIEITDQVPGDINGDGTFDYYDVSKLYAYYRNKTTLSESIDKDINGDGNFDYYDVSKLYAIYRGKANFN